MSYFVGCQLIGLLVTNFTTAQFDSLSEQHSYHIEELFLNLRPLCTKEIPLILMDNLQVECF